MTKSNMERRGLIHLGESATARFHLPSQWLTANGWNIHNVYSDAKNHRLQMLRNRAKISRSDSTMTFLLIVVDRSDTNDSLTRGTAFTENIKPLISRVSRIDGGVGFRPYDLAKAR